MDAATYTLKLSYSLFDTNRPMELYIDGVLKTTLNFNATTAWNKWAAVSTNQTLTAGSHTIVLKTTGSGGPNIDKLALTAVAGQTGAPMPTTYYVHNDHLGTPQVVTNQNKQVVFMADYQPFGKLTPGQTNSIELYSRFPGQFVDAETGNYYNYFRDYDPSIGRYIESDPIGLQGGINTYAYVEGNPLRFVDPNGQFAMIAIPAWLWWAGGGTAVAGGWWASHRNRDVPSDAFGGDMQQQMEYGANREQYHNRCDEKEPKNFLTECDRAKWNLQKAKDCKALRDAMTNRWFGGEKDVRHELHDWEIQNQIDSAERWVDQACKKSCILP